MNLNVREDGRIIRDPTRFFGGIAGAVALIALTAYIWMGPSTGRSIQIMLSAFTLLGIGYTGYLTFRPGAGFCPECGHRLTGLSLSQNPGRECPGCHTYVESTDGKLKPSTADSVAPHPVFKAPCPERAITWPEGCCVCGAPATHTIEATLEHKQDASFGKNLAVGVASAGFLTLVEKRKFELQVPHCAAHDGGAEIGFCERNQLPFPSFRAKRYADQFRQLNKEPEYWVDP